MDADQSIPWQNQTLVYYKKFRVYFQEVDATAPKHVQIMRHDWGIGADGDHVRRRVVWHHCSHNAPLWQDRPLRWPRL